MKVLEIVERELDNGVREIAIVGELDQSGIAPFEAAIERVRVADANLLVDFSACEFLDSTGLGEVVRAHQEAISRGRRAIVHGLRPEVERLFALSGLTENGLVVRSREDALLIATASANGHSNAAASSGQSSNGGSND